MSGLFSDAEISSMSGGIRVPPPPGYKLPDKFPSLRRAKRICLDLESHDNSLGNDMGPGWRRDAYIVGFALSIGDAKGKAEFSEYYPLRHKGAPNLDAERVLEWISDELAFYSGEITGANLLYDFDGFQYQSVAAPMAKFFDVQWAEALIDENAFDYKLNRLSKKYLGTGKVTEELKALYGNKYIERFEEVHPGHARAYGLGDVELPLGIAHEQEKELRKQDLERVWDVEKRLFPMLLYMRRKGQRIDVNAANQLREKFTQRREQELREASKLINRRGVELTVENFGKPSVLVAALTSLNIEFPVTALGNPSITDKWLENLEHPFGKHLAAANKYDKALETFVNGYLSNFAIADRLHCEFHPLRRVDDETGKNNGTVSGRFSSVHPNLQNIPTRDAEIGPLLRACFIPEEGYDWFSGDYSQIEYRLIVHAAVVRAAMAQPDKRWGKNAQELWQKMQSAYKAQERYRTDPTTDFHQMTADLTGLSRKYAKGINFGIAFTMGPEKLAAELGWTEPDPDKPGKMRPTQKAYDTFAQYHDNVPFVKAVGTATTREAEANVYGDSTFITTLLGRRTHFALWEKRYAEKGSQNKPLPKDQALALYGEKIKPSMTHKALNCFTQGSGADLMKTTMVNVWESGLLMGDDLIISLTVHDELDGSVARTAAGEEKLTELQHMMEASGQQLGMVVDAVSDFKRGHNWAETH